MNKQVSEFIFGISLAAIIGSLIMVILFPWILKLLDKYWDWVDKHF